METFNFNITLNGGEGEQLTPQQQDIQESVPSVANPEKTTGTVKTAAFTTIAIGAAKQAGNFVVNNIGDWTGDAHLAKQIETGTKLAGYGIMIATDPTPFKVASIAAIGLQVGMNAIELGQERKWQKQEYERAIQRMGIRSFRN